MQVPTPRVTLPLLLPALVLALACQRTPPRVVPPDAPTVRPPPVLTMFTAPGQRMPDNAVVEALQTGVFCYPFAGTARRGLWLVDDPPHVELTEEVTPGVWRRMAVDLATGVSRLMADDVDAETGLPHGVTPDEPGVQQPHDGLKQLHTPLGPTWLVRADKGAETLLEPTRAGLAPVVTVQYVSWQAAALVPGGVVAALLRQDSDNDGQPSMDDEVDLCLVARAVAPVAVPARRVPLARLAVMRTVSDAVDTALGPGALRLARWHDRGGRLELRVGLTACALDVPQTLVKLVDLADAVTAATSGTGGETMGIAVLCESATPTL